MNKQEKATEIEKIKNRFAKAQIAILTDYKGLKANEINDLRRKLGAQGSSMKVLKNRLAKIALKGSAHESLSSFLKGTVALTSTEGDPAGSAKILVAFAKDHEAIRFKTAYMQGRSLTEKDLQTLAKLPSREELVAKLLGAMLSPARAWVTVLSQIPKQVVNVLARVREQKEKEGEAKGASS